MPNQKGTTTKVRAAVSKQLLQLRQKVRVLRQQAAKSAAELKKALTDANRREQAGKAAAAKVEQLKGELAKKTAELKEKTTEFARSAKEWVAKAKAIPKQAPAAPSVPTAKTGAGPTPEPAPPTTDSDSSERTDR
jgi:hypothetical protein